MEKCPPIEILCATLGHGTGQAFRHPITKCILATHGNQGHRRGTRITIGSLWYALKNFINKIEGRRNGGSKFAAKKN